MDQMGLLLRVLLIWAVSLRCAVAKETEVRALAGTNVILPCRVDVNQCGTLHSVKWYRDTSRIYVFSQAGQIRRGEGDATERMNVTYNEARNETLLQISPVKVEDEATYKCEITYLEVGENCDVVQIVKLTTLVKPTSVIVTYNGKEVNDSTELEDKMEGSDVELTCKALSGKPIPNVNWYNGSQLVNRASYTTHRDDQNGVGSGISTLRLTLSRGDLNTRFECRVESQALDEPITQSLKLPVQVRPTKMELSGVNGHVVQGSKVVLTCKVSGARPRAVVRWYNSSNTKPIAGSVDDEIEVHTVHEESTDGTYTTKSNLMFPATRWENGKRFDCFAYNDVTKNKKELDLHELLYLDVRYPPVITISPPATIVNETVNISLSCTYFANPQKLTGATWLKDGKNITRMRGKHISGNVENPSLRVINIAREDMGEYKCWLQNEVGDSLSDDGIFVDVHYPPDVEIIMEPSTPVKANVSANVSLECNVTSGNPPTLRKVRWMLGGELMAALPECNYNNSQSLANETLGGPFCGIDPSILSLIKVDEGFAGNYTCQGENEAGVGPISEPRELIVYYPPSKPRVSYEPLKVIKRGQVTLKCTVDDPGRPDNVTYLWYRGGHKIHNITSSTWTISQALLETRDNFTCVAMNEGGETRSNNVSINVEAPPAFISNQNTKYKGVLYSSKNISLTCRIECWPLCGIEWYKDKQKMSFKSTNLYSVKTTVHPPDYNKNDFESVESTLIWNMENWPDKQLDKSASVNSNYTCASVSNQTYGTKVNFTTEIAVDFPPENLTASALVVNVSENQIPEAVKCTGSGHPKLSYEWKRNTTSESVGKGDTLHLEKMSVPDAGYYMCEASNKYGKKTALVYFNVQYKPSCTISMGDQEGVRALTCNTNANPNMINFTWRIHEGNDTIEYSDFETKGEYSYVKLDSSVNVERTYQCIANNSIGSSDPCHIYVPGNSAPWYMGKENLIVVVASIITLIICVIIVCIIIILMCRRKRQNTKSPNPSSTGDKMRIGAAPPVGGSADPANDLDKGFYENLPFHGMQNPPNKNAFYTLTTPHYKHINVGLPPQYSATIPHQKHVKLIPRALFNEQLPKSKSFSSKPKHKKHFQIPLQKCHSFKFQTAESYFQPIKNIHEEDLMKNGYVSDYPESSRGRHHKREKPKQKTKGPLVLRRPDDYRGNVQFPENVQNSVQLQYPQPIVGRGLRKSNGVVYADLDMPKANKKGAQETASSQSKSQKSKPKTEYATLSFNDIGQEIDV